MILNLQSAVNVNGWSRQLQIDTERKTFRYGAFIFSQFEKTSGKIPEKALKDIKTACIDAGFMEA